MRVFLTGALACALTGCATSPSSQAAHVADADDRMVVSCQYVGDVQGSSGWGGLAASTGMNNARVEARERAAKLGATHIVWRHVDGGYVPNVSARAYKCPAALTGTH